MFLVTLKLAVLPGFTGRDIKSSPGLAALPWLNVFRATVALEFFFKKRLKVCIGLCLSGSSKLSSLLCPRRSRLPQTINTISSLTGGLPPCPLPSACGLQ